MLDEPFELAVVEGASDVLGDAPANLLLVVDRPTNPLQRLVDVQVVERVTPETIPELGPSFLPALLVPASAVTTDLLVVHVIEGVSDVVVDSITINRERDVRLTDPRTSAHSVSSLPLPS